MSTTLTETVQRLHNSDDGEDNDRVLDHGYGRSGISEIEEEEESSSQLAETHRNGAMATIREEHGDDSVYVAVGKSETSMVALSWAIKNLVSHSPSTTILYLIHVFPEIKHIPNPLGAGMIPKDQVSSEQVESYMAQERGKRRELLNKFLHSCSASKVEVDTILIESDMVAKAILDLIPILHIKNLVIGTNKSNLRKSKSKRGNGIADQILQSEPEGCKVRIICEGKEVTEQILRSPTLSPSPRPNSNENSMHVKEVHQQKNMTSCICFNF
ncbi:hypothetical protein L6164_036054 [Bauhinia variegata]|uniref:Uncharacterized protein n=1 Tax=Bauhinia variegata TaxID=167791 RepID=A0ACB9KFR3_BAUVA|nr:hypothetical protein L6164_036054 [Bauhinia variegata]